MLKLCKNPFLVCRLRVDLSTIGVSLVAIPLLVAGKKSTKSRNQIPQPAFNHYSTFNHYNMTSSSDGSDLSEAPTYSTNPFSIAAESAVPSRPANHMRHAGTRLEAMIYVVVKLLVCGLNRLDLCTNY